MIRCPDLSVRNGARPFTPELLMHHGAENSALKKSAPSSLTSLKTSESTSIAQPLCKLGVCGKNTALSIKYSIFTGRTLELEPPCYRRNFVSVCLKRCP